MERHFFQVAATPTLAEIAQLVGARLEADAPADWRPTGLASLEEAGPGDLSFFVGKHPIAVLRRSRAGACFLATRDASAAPASVACLLTADPARAFAQVAAILYPGALRPSAALHPGISIGATIEASARLEVGASIAPGVILGARVEVGTRTSIGPGCIFGDNVKIGRDCTIGPHVTISHALIGDRVVVHAGARVGQDGFGFIPGAKGHLKLAQLGRVIVQDDVEIGANTAIDRGALDDTIIGEGTKIDNLVQIAHNVVIGRHCLIAAQAGIAGSTRLGDFVAVGGQAGIAGHLTIGAGARIAGKAGVLHDVAPKARIGGSPAGPVTAWLRTAVRNRRRMHHAD